MQLAIIAPITSGHIKINDMSAPAVPQLTLEQGKAALAEAVAAFDIPENKAKMDAAIASAGGDQQKMMMAVMPVAMQIQQEVLARYGFPKDGTGVMAATMQLQMLAAQDPQVAADLAALKAKFVPNM